LGTGFFVHHRIVSAAKTVEFVSDRVSYIVLRGHHHHHHNHHRPDSPWWAIVLNVNAPSKEKTDDSKVIFMRN